MGHGHPWWCQNREVSKKTPGINLHSHPEAELGREAPNRLQGRRDGGIADYGVGASGTYGTEAKFSKVFGAAHLAAAGRMNVGQCFHRATYWLANFTGWPSRALLYSASIKQLCNTP